MKLIPRRWADFQHYKNRRPPWIKLHKALLDDREYQRLPLASRALAPMLWLLASESGDGIFEASTEELTFRLRQPAKDIDAGLAPLIEAGFFTVVQGASTPLADRQQLAVTDKSREEADAPRDKTAFNLWQTGFDEFWDAYPKKRAKDDAVKAFSKRKPDRDLLAQMLKAIETQRRSDDWAKDNGQFIPYPATWLNDGRWMDEINAKPNAGSSMFAGGI